MTTNSSGNRAENDIFIVSTADASSADKIGNVVNLKNSYFTLTVKENVLTITASLGYYASISLLKIY